MTVWFNEVVLEEGLLSQPSEHVIEDVEVEVPRVTLHYPAPFQHILRDVHCEINMVNNGYEIKKIKNTFCILLFVSI